MNTQQHEKYLQVINTIGIEKVQQLYFLLGDERISMASLQKLIVRNQREQVINCKESARDLAKRLKVSHMTVYRYLKKK